MLTSTDWNAIIAYADSGMSKVKAGDMCFMHANTVKYHLNKVRQETNLNPDNFYDLYELVGMAVDELKKAFPELYKNNPLQIP